MGRSTLAICYQCIFLLGILCTSFLLCVVSSPLFNCSSPSRLSRSSLFSGRFFDLTCGCAGFCFLLIFVFIIIALMKKDKKLCQRNGGAIIKPVLFVKSRSGDVSGSFHKPWAIKKKFFPSYLLSSLFLLPLLFSSFSWLVSRSPSLSLNEALVPIRISG